jgi:GT2 family glycosyltransferase
MDAARKMAINVVTWNSQDFLRGFLSSAAAQDSNDFSLTVVDNASTDGTVNWLRAEHPEIATLRNFRNLGFARAHNQAIELALSRWIGENLHDRFIMVANPDLEFAPNAIRLILAFMSAYPEVDICGPKLLRIFLKPDANLDECEAQRSNIIDSTGLVINRARRVVDRGAGEEDRGQYSEAAQVFGLSGACVIFRASALAQAKLAGEYFDEDFFAYKEDVDLAWRMQRLGLGAYYLPQAVVWHHRHVPAAPTAGWFRAWRKRRQKSPRINYWSSRNHAWLLIKNDEWLNLVCHAPWWLPYEFMKLAAGLFSWSDLRGRAAALGGLARMFKKRAELAGRVKVKGAAMRQWFV